MESIFEEGDNLKDFLGEAELQQYYELFRDILKVTKLSQLKFVVTEDLGQIGLSKPEQRRYKKIYSKFFPNPYMSKIKKFLTPNKRNNQCFRRPPSIPIEINTFSEISVKGTPKHIISIEDITINKELGMGQFGVVQQGTWTTANQKLQVAIKCLGNERMMSNSNEFLKEAAVMHSIEHPNIVRLYGVVLHLDSLMLVTELAALRSLLECLREVSLRVTFSVLNLCEFAVQICDGMAYLEKKRLIHRDLAARNILVFSKERVKISDFGLSRALGVGKDYYQTNYNVNLKLPVAWCAPECILFLRFTSSSDVWAFGVCLWEMFTYGFQPWAPLSGQHILEAIDSPNFQRLERPECCPEAYYTTMLECWSHDPNDRPKFKDLSIKLRKIRPEQVQTTADYKKTDEERNCDILEYKLGEIITVLGKQDMTKTTMWYGTIPGGACGIFDPQNTKPFTKTYEIVAPKLLSPHPARSSTRSFMKPPLQRSDLKRHTYTGKRTIQRSMISSPQGDVKHMGHVGLDGAYFGDISFLDPAGCLPRQIVTAYKPSKDSEQVPLINPNSPSHLSGSSCVSPYPMLTGDGSHAGRNEDRNVEVDLDLACGDSKPRSHKKNTYKMGSEPTTSKSILSKMKAATLLRSHKGEDCSNASAFKQDELHEYHEISDTETENNVPDSVRIRNPHRPDSPAIGKNYGEFSESLLEKMESMFQNMEDLQPDTASSSKHSALRAHTLNKLEKKKGLNTGTMKAMSAHEEKTLDTAVALANEITTRSMTDLDGVNKQHNSSSGHYKFHLKFPRSHGNQSPDLNKDASGKQERRNFSEEANSVPDIQATITRESKIAYTSLIEEPTPSSTLISQISKESQGLHKPATAPQPPPRTDSRPNFHLQMKRMPNRIPIINVESVDESKGNEINVLPLPPRSTKPKLVDKPRHIRKYPLKMPNIETETKPNTDSVVTKPTAIYQNALPIKKDIKNIKNSKTKQTQPKLNGDDVFDGPSVHRVQTNPFKSESPPSSANPFSYYLETLAIENNDLENASNAHLFQEGSLVKDYVSVEDLLKFADQKPCGRQRGVESDEVRIMSKVLKQEVTPEECLEALELSDWNVYHAIKLIRVKIAVGVDVSLVECCSKLADASGDITKASDLLIHTI